MGLILRFHPNKCVFTRKAKCGCFDLYTSDIQALFINTRGSSISGLARLVCFTPWKLSEDLNLPETGARYQDFLLGSQDSYK